MEERGFIVSSPSQKIATVYLFESIKRKSVGEIIATLDGYNYDDEVGEVRIIICSDGGSTESASALCDFMRASSKVITTIGLGEVSSSAIMILASGDKGQRFISPNACGELHAPYYPEYELKTTFKPSQHGLDLTREHERGQYYIDSLKASKELMLTTLSVHATNEQKRKLKSILDRDGDTRLSANDFIELGLADSILHTP